MFRLNAFRTDGENDGFSNGIMSLKRARETTRVFILLDYQIILQEGISQEVVPWEVEH